MKYLRSFLSKLIGPVDSIEFFHKDVNTLYFVIINNKKYSVKLMQRTPEDNFEGAAFDPH